ncbi:hypothetical protein ACIA8E_40505 [Streptomyces sp. NPDC051664]|uniref:hypothetical protein n=1 Tax=Streptomyces sp. NPDC051664 TaxID=3365668 RepID=UPI0037ADB2F6
MNTVLGPLPTEELSAVSVHEALLSVVSGAELTFDITMDRAEIFETLAAKLKDFRAHGGGTIGRKWHGAPWCWFTEGWKPPFGGSGCGRDERFRPHQVRWFHLYSDWR